MGAALEAMIYGVAGFCVLRLRRRQPDAARPVPLPRAAGARAAGYGRSSALLAVTASVSVQNRFDPAPLVIILAAAR